MRFEKIVELVGRVHRLFVAHVRSLKDRCMNREDLLTRCSAQLVYQEYHLEQSRKSVKQICQNCAKIIKKSSLEKSPQKKLQKLSSTSCVSLVENETNRL